MCGIVAVLGSQDTSATRRIQIVDCARKLRHRGPDWSGIHHSGNNFLAHERLAIIDPASGDQPLYSEDKSIVVTVNGEIYNHEQLKKGLTGKHTYRTGSDCEVIPHLYEEVGEDVASLLDGMFSFVLLDNKTGNFMAARDPIGITPLYMGWGRDGSVWFASEMKALTIECDQFQEFPPGHIYSSKQGGLRRYYNPPWFDEHIPSGPLDLPALRVAFEKAVVKRLMTDVPFGVLLSGGLDSSLVASVASRHLAETKAAVWGPKLHTFSVGLPGSPDLKAAREVADILGTDHHELTFSVQRPKLQTFSVGFPGSSDLKAAREVAKILGTDHHEFTFSLQDGLDALSEVIYHIETYDVTTIRASTPMFLMSRKIRAIGVKMVLSGEGSDEIFGGYLYFHKAPNKEEFHKETCRKIKALHMYDCLRANKSTSAWGIEARVPFLDKEFIDVAMAIDPQYKMAQKFKGKPIEKFIIRKAFDTPENPFLPEHILYRQKEQFSDGVGYSWIDGLKEFAEKQVTDQMMQHAEKAFPVNSPKTKEGYYYRTLFEKHFPQHAAALTVPGGPSVACSTAAAIEWDKAWANMLDPSGRAATGVHDSAYEAKAAANGV